MGRIKTRRQRGKAEPHGLTIRQALRDSADSQWLFENRVVTGWLTTKQAADYLKISTNALRLMSHREKVVAHKVGRMLRFHIKDLQSVLIRKGG